MFNQLFGRYFKISFIIFIIIDILSYFAYQDSVIHLIIFIILTLLILGLTLYKLEFGLYILLAELFIGSQGHLLSLPTPYFSFSIRIAIFTIVFLVWLSKVLKGLELSFFKQNNKFLYIYLLLFIILAGGALNGLLNNSFKKVFFDLNGWLFFAITPIIFSQIRTERVVQNILTILVSAVAFISVKTLIIMTLFAYQFPINISIFYTWLRDSRIGEITHVTGTFYRIFFQAQIYVLVGFIVSFLLIIFKDRLQLLKKVVKNLKWIAILSSTALIACLSRSFWVGAICALLIIFGLLIFKYRFSFSKIIKLVLVMIVITVLEIGFLLVASGTITAAWLKGRLEDPTEESAGMSRIAQLGPLWEATNQHFLLGSGFGKTVTYFTDDPRIRAKSPSGLYTTYAFEWGYLDIWLKVGLIGLVIYLYLYYLVFKKGIKIFKKQPEFSIFLLALLLGLVAIVTTSIFSPYMNHPLGIGYLILISSIICFITCQYETEQS